MTTQISNSLKAVILTVALAFSVCLAQGAFSSPLLAQPEPGEPGYQYPALTDEDFRLYLALVKFISNGGDDPQVFYRQQGVTEEHTQAVFLKISMNTMGKLMDSMDEAVSEYGKTIVFSSAEERLFSKYESEIMSGLISLGQQSLGN